VYLDDGRGTTHVVPVGVLKATLLALLDVDLSIGVVVIATNDVLLQTMVVPWAMPVRDGDKE
jgi:hypothetical protein